MGDGKLDRVAFERCRLRESLWSNVKLVKARFDECDVTRAQWMRTPLRGLNMATCEIAGWTIDLFDLRGMKVTAIQAVQLSGLLGIEIVE